MGGPPAALPTRFGEFKVVAFWHNRDGKEHLAVEANLALGFGDDEQDYAIAAHMVQSLTLQSVRHMTNNPRKLDGLKQRGIRVAGRSGHLLDVAEQGEALEEEPAAKQAAPSQAVSRRHAGSQDPARLTW